MLHSIPFTTSSTEVFPFSSNTLTSKILAWGCIPLTESESLSLPEIILATAVP